MEIRGIQLMKKIKERELKPEYQDLEDEFESLYGDGSCSCSSCSMPPCGYCESSGCHDGSPEALDDNDDAWIYTTEEIEMTKIENVTLINGKRKEEYELDALIKLIDIESLAISKLELIRVGSRAIESKIKKHNEVIKQIVTIMDEGLT